MLWLMAAAGARVGREQSHTLYGATRNSRQRGYASEMLSLSTIINRGSTFHGLVDHRRDSETAKTCGAVERRRTMTAGIRGTRNWSWTWATSPEVHGSRSLFVFRNISSTHCSRDLRFPEIWDSGSSRKLIVTARIRSASQDTEFEIVNLRSRTEQWIF